MKDMRHLKTFESFSPNQEAINEEEILGIFKSKLSKVIDSFKLDNKNEFERLKEFEKEGGDKLKKMQKLLNHKLSEFKKSLITNMKNEDSQVDNINDINVVFKDLSDIINNVDPDESGSVIQKVSRGSSGGFKRSGA